MISERLTGDKSRLPFDVLLSLRSQFIAHPATTILAILAVTASVALAASVEVASRSVSSALERSMNAVAGTTQLEVTAAAQGVPEELIDKIREMPGVQSASPVISESFRIVRDTDEEESLRVIGIDLLYDREVRDYAVSTGGFRVRDHVRLVALGDSIVLSEPLSIRLRVSEGDKLTLRSPSGLFVVTVRGILGGDLSAAYGGSLAIMDVFALQRMLALDGTVQRIDVSAKSGTHLDSLREAVTRVVSTDATVRRSTLRDNVVAPILSAYGFGLWSITLIGVLLSLFLTYAVISIVVDRRVTEFALLRAAGMEAARASKSVVVDAAILAAVGSALGVSIALAFASRLVVFLSRASQFYQDLAVEPAEATATTIVAALAVGVPIALLACIEPARRAGRRAPLDVLHGRDVDGVRIGSSSRLRLPIVIGSSVFAVALIPWGLGPAPRLAMAVGGGTVTVWALTGAFLPSIVPRLQVALTKLVPRVGVLVGASIGDRPVEAGATIAIWAAVFAAAFSLLTSLNGLGASMDEFIANENGANAIMAFGEDPGTTAPSGRLPLDQDVVRAIERVEGVAGVWFPRSTTVMFRGQEVPIDDYDVDKLVRNGGLRGFSTNPEASISALKRGELLASDSFLWRFGLGVGDEITLRTAVGLQQFRIGGDARSFSGPQGKLYLEAGRFGEFFRSRGAGNIVFWINGDHEETLARVRAAVSGSPLFFRDGEAFRRQAERVIGRFSALLTIPLMVVASIGFIGLANLLIGNVAARRRDLSLLRASGGTSWNVVSVVALSAVLTALIGTAAGVLLGVSWSIVIRDAIAHFLGWSMGLAIDWLLLCTLAGVALAAAVAVAAAPAALTTLGDDSYRSLS